MKRILLIAILLIALPAMAVENCIAVQKKEGDRELSALATNPDYCYTRNGKWTGIWEVRYANGNVDTGPMVDGKRHWQWEFRHADGIVGTGPYVDGKQHGQWEFRFADGSVIHNNIINGQLQE